jgi:peptidoglycan hydrolase CwlO-like protein
MDSTLTVLALVSGVIGIMCSLTVLYTFKVNSKKRVEDTALKQTNQDRDIQALAVKLEDLAKLINSKFAELDATIKEFTKELNRISTEHEVLISQHEINHGGQKIKRG